MFRVLALPQSEGLTLFFTRLCNLIRVLLANSNNDWYIKIYKYDKQANGLEGRILHPILSSLIVTPINGRNESYIGLWVWDQVKLWSLQLQFQQHRREAFQNSGLQQGSCDSRWQCDAVTNWAMKAQMVGAGHLWVQMFLWWMNIIYNIIQYL